MSESTSTRVAELVDAIKATRAEIDRAEAEPRPNCKCSPLAKRIGYLTLALNNLERQLLRRGHCTECFDAFAACRCNHIGLPDWLLATAP